LKPAEQHFWQIDHFGKLLPFSAPPCLDGAKTKQSTRFELLRCLGNKSGLVRLVRAPNCRLTSVFESPRPKGRVALVRFPPAPPPGQVENSGRNKRPTVAELRRRVLRGQPPPYLSVRTTRRRLISLETSGTALLADRPFWETSAVFSSTLPRRREDQAEHPV
jgi:hypothetical protein